MVVEENHFPQAVPDLQICARAGRYMHIYMYVIHTNKCIKNCNQKYPGELAWKLSTFIHAEVLDLIPSTHMVPQLSATPDPPGI